MDHLKPEVRAQYLADLRAAKTWELLAHVESTQKRVCSALRRWEYYCREMHFKTDLGGHPDPVTAIQV